MRRAELALNQAIMLLLALFTLVLVLALLLVISNTAAATTVKTACQVTLELRSFGEGSLAGFFNPFKLYCPRSVIRVQDNELNWENHHLVAGISKKIPYSYRYYDMERETWIERFSVRANDQEDQPELLASLVADEMVKCWDLFSQGEKTFMDGKLFDTRVGCVICSEIYVDADVLTPEQTLPLTQVLDEKPSSQSDTPPSLTQYLYGVNEVAAERTYSARGTELLNARSSETEEIPLIPPYAVACLDAELAAAGVDMESLQPLKGDSIVVAYVHDAAGIGGGRLLRFEPFNSQFKKACSTVVAVPATEVYQICDLVLN